MNNEHPLNRENVEALVFECVDAGDFGSVPDWSLFVTLEALRKGKRNVAQELSS